MRQTIAFEKRVAVRACASTVGPKEGKGPLGWCFDRVLQYDLLGQESWELAESRMMQDTIEMCLAKAGLPAQSVEVLLAGDLQGQIMSSAFAARELGMPYLGLYGACSTMIEAMAVGGILVEGGYRKNALCSASSHFCTAERQFRGPVELGSQRPPSASWTTTACGALLLDGGKQPGVARLTHATLGRVVDYQVKDANHMGAAMAPAVADTITAHLTDTGRSFADYDLIATGDLGYIGRNILKELLIQRGVKVADEKLIDCGASMFSREQDAHAGGSGCGCVASVTCGYILRKVQAGEYHRVLVIGSGALLSLTTQQQGQTIPGIAFAAALEGES